MFWDKMSFLCQTHVQAMRAVKWVSPQTVAVTQRLSDGVTYGVSLQRERQEIQRKRVINTVHHLNQKNTVILHLQNKYLNRKKYFLVLHALMSNQGKGLCYLIEIHN